MTSATCSAETIRKWTDEQGKIHYGDIPPSGMEIQLQHVDIYDDFDQVEHEKAIQRQKSLYQQIRKIEEQENERRRKAETRLQKYFDYLDKQELRQKRRAEKIRKAREAERNKTSIKLKRSKRGKHPETEGRR
jgi:hypothetical protein